MSWTKNCLLVLGSLALNASVVACDADESSDPSSNEGGTSETADGSTEAAVPLTFEQIQTCISLADDPNVTDSCGTETCQGMTLITLPAIPPCCPDGTTDVCGVEVTDDLAAMVLSASGTVLNVGCFTHEDFEARLVDGYPSDNCE